VRKANDPVRVRAGELQDFIGSIFGAVGMSPDDATMAADALVRTEMRGIVTHGVRHVPRYVRSILDGGIDPRAEFQVVRETASTATVEAHAGLGHVVATKAVRLAMSKAADHGVATVLARNSSHLGAPGHYALLAAEADMIAIVFSTTPRVMKAPGSRTAVVGSSPVAYAVPSRGAPFVLDASMSVVAGNRINIARERGEPVPEGWIVDSDGVPSTNPDDYRLGGALVPIGGHKGFGIAVFTELLAGALSGLDWDHQAESKTRQPGSAYFADLTSSDQWNSGHAFVVLDVKAFLDPAEMRDRADRLRSVIKSAEPEPGSEGVRLPGERASASEAEARREGVQVSAGTWSSLQRVATELGLAVSATADS
jgi:LDH2 family malate/lactate/ureidoglycolate dehydrogenase